MEPDVLLAGDDEPDRGGDVSAVDNPNSLLSPKQRNQLSELCTGKLRFNEPMRRHTTLKIGGPADALAAPISVDDVVRLCQWCAANQVPLTVVGGGSNLLVRDGGIRGVVLSTRALRGLALLTPTTISVEAGVSTGKLLAFATANSLGGVEFLGGVPGSVGGGLIMNAGTYVGEFTNVTTHVTSIVLASGSVVRREHAACGFRYRSSDLPASEVVVAAELALTPRPRIDIETDIKALRRRRAEREPLRVASNGSTFKNPPASDDGSPRFAGQLIEAAGCKGWREGPAICSPTHANWLVNEGGATAAQLENLIERVRTRVKEAHGITLELEVKRLGDPA